MRRNVIIILFILLNVFSVNSFSQELTENTNWWNELSLDQYNVINSVFREGTILPYTDNSKTWAYLMSPYYLDGMFGGCVDQKAKRKITWEELLSNEDFEKINSRILGSHPIELDKSKLNPEIKIVIYNSLDEYDLSLVTSISAPIIIGDIAIFKKSSSFGEIFVVAKRSENGWEVVCHKFPSMRTYSPVIFGDKKSLDKSRINRFIKYTILKDSVTADKFLNDNSEITISKKLIEFQMNLLKSQLLNRHYIVLPYKEFKQKDQYRDYTVRYSELENVYCVVANKKLITVFVVQDSKIISFSPGLIKNKNRINPLMLNDVANRKDN